MSEERAPLPAGGSGLLGASRSRSYGSFRSSLSRQKPIEHQVQPGETLQGLALKYGVSMEQIKRANRLYTNESVFLKKSLFIPVLSDCAGDCGNGVALTEEDSADPSSCVSAQNVNTTGSSDKKQKHIAERSSELSPVDFLKRIDGLISQSTQAAVKGCQEAEKRVAALEAACTSETMDRRRLTRSQSAFSSSSGTQQNAHLAVPLTATKLTMKLRDREDEIFEL
ncbi:hypothetical protein LDENG_00234200 [Lucifuga dentata]|nr:hypothetical protein LDENG_00234200 [Lucifuga dentata]